MDAIVYTVSARTIEQFWQQRDGLRALVFEMEAFANVPFLILCIRNLGINLSEGGIVDFLEQVVRVDFLHRSYFRTGRFYAHKANAQAFVVDEFNREHYLEGIRWLYDDLTNY